MKAIISTTYDDKYLYFLPIVTWLWNRLGVDVICFMPENRFNDKFKLVNETMIKNCESFNNAIAYFRAPKHKEATYAQCSRLYGACLDLPEDEVLVIGDVDMALFSLPVYIDYFTIFGYDLVPENQYPMCYISATVNQWRRAIDYKKTYQENLDALLGGIEAEHFRGNYWGKDQETAFQILQDSGTKVLLDRAREGTQFASKRIDRDDSYWVDRLTPDIIDAHLWRPGYTDENFPKILHLLKYFYPQDDFTWLVNYTEQYKSLL